MEILVAVCSSSGMIQELEDIYRELYAGEEDAADFGAAREWWNSLSPKALKAELEDARDKLKSVRKSSHSSSQTLKRKLQASGIPSDVIEALLKAVSEGLLSRDPSANAYARSMELSYDDYDLDGVKMQILYLLLYLKSWTGDEARAAKKLLNKWAKSK